MTDLGKFISDAKAKLERILDESGGILNSSAARLTKGDYYLLGQNPGGNEVACVGATIRKDLEEMPGRKGSDLQNSDWGAPRLQRQLELLFGAECLGADLGNVCASNLIFTRSQNVRGMKPEHADLCWPVHEMILRIVQPRVILAFGNGDSRPTDSPYAYLKMKHLETKGEVPKQTSEPAQHGSWSCCSFDLDLGWLQCRVIGLPHLSRYSLDGKQGVLKWIKEQATQAMGASSGQ